jgi:hypothetical protein
MLANLGFVFLAAMFGWAAFYCLRRAKGSVWAHWFGWVLALLGGFGLVGTIADSMFDWAASYVVMGGAAIITLGLGIPALFDILKDRKPDTVALIAALVLPSVMLVGMSQLGSFASNSWERMQDTGRNIQQTTAR